LNDALTSVRAKRCIELVPANATNPFSRPNHRERFTIPFQAATAKELANMEGPMIPCPETSRGLLRPPAFKFPFRQNPISNTVSIGRDPPCVCHPHLPDNRPCLHRFLMIRFHPPRANPHATRHAGPTPHPNRHIRHPTLREDDEDVENILTRSDSPHLASLQHPHPHSGQFRSATPRLPYISGSSYSKSQGSAAQKAQSR